ncbi:MAG: NAD(P)/FAD-dependent oxidoreductase [Sorangiineae bacterium]|nr:NAD(P)/FAD-dependent oxidoreductase [Polyangiaceae bacterium]MEB2322967.1 NAD(P)/FAD-dependent oxidoreductase [Sorangiineae bacterium]
MTDATAPMFEGGFDAVVIGAGHNGMALAGYLAKSGWSVAVLERRTEEGGGLCTEEVTEPAFLHNLHSNYHSLVGLSPVYDDLALLDNGVEYAHPEVQMGSIFTDGTAMTIHTDMAKTYQSFARFSKKDADTWMRLYDEVSGFMDLMVRTLMFAPPISLRDLTRALASWGVEDRTEFLTARLRSMSVADFLNRHFENDRIKAMLAFHAAICAYQPHVKGLAVSYPVLLGKITNWHLCLGGSHRLAHALMRVIVRAGGRVFPQVPVEEIVVEDGRAIGVRTPSGFVRAHKLVASSIDVNQTFQKLLPPERVPERTLREVEQVEYQDATLFNLHTSMNGLPRYHAAAFDPDIDRAWILNVGFDSLADFDDEFSAIRQGRLPEKLRLNVAVNSLYDPTDAPPGKATGLVRVFAPFTLAEGGAEAWERRGPEFGREVLARWMKECANPEGLTRKTAVETPLDIAEKMINYRFGDWMVGRVHPKNLLERRPTEELANYRTPISGLYMCGASQHPHGYITFAPGYNCLRVIAEDFGMERWWDEV